MFLALGIFTTEGEKNDWPYCLCQIFVYLTDSCLVCIT